jgi:hypothetical protein
MATKRPTAKTSPAGGSPLINAALFALALVLGAWLLYARGRVSWPPTELLASVYTVAGCLALVGPVVLLRRGGDELGLGELLWMAGGLLIWIFDLAALARGDLRLAAGPTPLSYQPMGLTILAVLIAGWRCRLGGPGWSWTNVTGWVLGLFWVGMAATTLLPARATGMAMR